MIFSFKRFFQKGNTTIFFFMILTALLFAGGGISVSHAEPAPAPSDETGGAMLKDINYLMQGLHVAPAWQDKIGMCISTLPKKFDPPEANPIANELLGEGKLHILILSRVSGRWDDTAKVYGIATDEWSSEAAVIRLSLMIQEIGKIVPPQYDMTIEWWDESQQFRLYFHPFPFNDVKFLKAMVLRLKTTK